jgi:hypothetical protein
MDNLPNEIIYLISSFCNDTTIMNLRLVSYRFSKIRFQLNNSYFFEYDNDLLKIIQRFKLETISISRFYFYNKSSTFHEIKVLEVSKFIREYPLNLSRFTNVELLIIFCNKHFEFHSELIPQQVKDIHLIDYRFDLYKRIELNNELIKLKKLRKVHITTRFTIEDYKIGNIEVIRE